MRKSELEAWVLDVIARVEAGQPNEDARVELKREWPESQKAARRIAGHANAAGGDPVLWIIGVDQAAGIAGADALELPNWLSQVRAEFNELAPDLLIDLNIPARGKTVVALLFATDRAPFVVKNPMFGSAGGGSIELEVPWREGTRVRSATRAELLRILSPLQRLPNFEILEGSLKMKLPDEEGGRSPSFWLMLKLYAVPKIVPVVLPYHRCKGMIRIMDFGIKTPLSKISIYRHGKIFGVGRTKGLGSIGSTMIEESYSEVIINGPGMLQLEAKSSAGAPLDVLPLGEAQAIIEIFPADAERPCTLTANFRYLISKGNEHEWFLIGEEG